MKDALAILKKVEKIKEKIQGASVVLETSAPCLQQIHNLRVFLFSYEGGVEQPLKKGKSMIDHKSNEQDLFSLQEWTPQYTT